MMKSSCPLPDKGARLEGDLLQETLDPGPDLHRLDGLGVAGEVLEECDVPDSGVATVTSGGVGATVSGCPPHPTNIPATTTAEKKLHANPRADPMFLMFITGDSPRYGEPTSRLTLDFGAKGSTPPQKHSHSC